MSKFWTAVALVFAVAIMLLLGSGSPGISFSDLETECRYDRSGSSNIDLSGSDKLSFSGQFPVDNPDSDLSYRYRTSGDRITLSVKSEGLEEPASFERGCLGIAVYSAETGRLDPGSYLVTVKHDGEKVNRQVIQVG